MPKFIPGLELNRRYYEEVVRPLMQKHFPSLQYSAGLTGVGSDTLGLDNEQSMDHNWGPRGCLFFNEHDLKSAKIKVNRILKSNLPRTFMGFPTNFSKPRKQYIVQHMEPSASGPINHLMRFYSVRSFFEHYLGFNPYQNVTTQDWLTFPQQALIEVTGGEVFHDGLGKLGEIRSKFAFYPSDVWLYMMRVQWIKIANELSYQARSGQAGDETGSRILAASMVDKIMKMSFLQHRQYFPYNKWIGSFFERLPSAPILTPLFHKILNSASWQVRQQYISRAHQELAKKHNELGVTGALPTRLSRFPGRHYVILDVAPYIKTLNLNIKSKKLRHMKYTLGSIDQFIDHTRINHENYVYKLFKNVIK